MTQNFPQRRTTRLTEYDYGQEGLYFVTICTQDKLCRFGNIVHGEMILNDGGKAAQDCWINIPPHFPHVRLHDFIIMPNHFHGIIEILENENVGMPLVGIHKEKEKGQPQGIAPTIGQIIGAFKSIATNKYIQGVEQNNWESFHNRLWQRNYYDHIIRNSQSFTNITNYIYDNPANWDSDEYYNITK